MSKKPHRAKAQRSKAKSGSRKKKKSAALRSPKGVFMKLITLPFRLIFNITRGAVWWVRWPLRAGLTMAFMMSLLLLLLICIYFPRAYFGYELNNLDKMAARTEVFAKDNQTSLGRLHGTNRYMVKHSEVNDWMKKALIAQEDQTFHKHHGVDLLGTLRIPYHYIVNKKKLGASTITMQLARNSFPLGGRTLDRKLLEMAVAVRIEQKYSKDEILELYMNRIFLGHSIHGVEAASRAYFEKNAKDLTLGEAAMIAGIVRGPNDFSPFRSMERALRERDRALDRMLKCEFITQEQSDKAKQESINLRPPNRRSIKDSYAMDAIDGELKVILEKHKIKMGGLKVYTTIDHNLQYAAEKSLNERLTKVENLPNYRNQKRSDWQSQPALKAKDPKYLQGAIVCMENKTGAVLAIVGGRNAVESKYNRAQDATPQVGSIIKPFIYLSAFQQGMSRNHHIKDTQVARGWPKNYDGKYYKTIPVTTALSQSRNCAAVHAGIFAGNDIVEKTLKSAGFQKYTVTDKSTFLGNINASPWEIASAYTIFPNGGQRYQPHLITHIVDKNGVTVYKNTGIVYQAASTRQSWNVSYALREVTRTGTARALQGHLNFREPCGGKTGTTDNSEAAWFAGYTSSVTCAVWVGLDNPTNIIPNGSGSSLALPIWADVMKTANRLGYPTQAQQSPIQRVVPVE